MASPLSTTALFLNSILSTTLSTATPALTAAQFGQIPQIGLPSGRGTTIQSASNLSPSTAQKLGILKGQALFNGSVTQADPIDRYEFQVQDSRNWSFLLSGLVPVATGTGLTISIVDAQGVAVSALTAQEDGSTKLLSGSLRPGTYTLAVSGQVQNSSYRISLIEGNTYFVSSTGSNTNLGTYAAPFSSIENAANRADPGDTIMIRGGTYYDRVLNLVKSGTADRPITIESVPGEFVAIDHGFQTGAWSATENANIFRSTPLIPDPKVESIENILRVVVNNTPLVKAASREAMIEGSFWVDEPNKMLYTWAVGGINPANQEVLILAGRTDGLSAGIRVFDTANHIVIDGISDRAADAGLWAGAFLNPEVRGTDITLRNSEIKFAWDYAIRFDNWEGALLENNNVHNNAQINYPRSASAIWPHAVIGFKSRDVTVIGNRIHDNNGEGVGPYIGSDRWKILNNIVHDNWSVNVYVDTDLGDVVVDGNFIYNTPGRDVEQPIELHDGIRLANEAADLGKADPDPSYYNIQITNNIIVGTGGGIRSLPYAFGPSFLKDSIIANNTIGPLMDNARAIEVGAGDNVTVVNNLAVSNPILLTKGLGAIGIVASNNWVSDPTQFKPPTRRKIKVTNTQFGDPKLLVGTGILLENYGLQPGSPLFGAGVGVPQVKTDYLGRPRSTDRPSIGAFELPITVAELPKPQPQPQPQPQPVNVPVTNGFTPTTLAEQLRKRLRFGRS